MKSATYRNLEIRAVEEKDVDQFNDLLSYVFQITQSDIEESNYDNKSDFVKSKRPILEMSKVFGWFNKEELVSQIAIYPCTVNIHAKMYKMGGVTGVGTYPEYSNRGLIKELIKLALNTMRQDQQWISYLYPYNISYYRRKGWEIMSDKLTFTISDTQLPKEKRVDGIVERKEVDDPDVYIVYNKFSTENHGTLQRTSFHWQEYWRYENEEDRKAAIYYNSEGTPTGVLFYWIAEEIFHIKEMFYLDQESRNGLWNFISAHFSMVDSVKGSIYTNDTLSFYLDDGQIEEIVEPYYMARIVDVEEFLKNYPFKHFEGSFHFVVSDPLAPWNNGIFGVEYVENKIRVSKKALGNPVELDIQTLSCLLMSYRRPTYLLRIERLNTDLETLMLLESIIPDTTAYFSDYF